MSTDPNTVNLIYIVVELLLPIIPAFILHRYLPNKTFVKGPLKGLQINLSGAFAGYFLLFFLLYLAPRPLSSEVWKVVGTISPNSKITPEYQIDCRISPPLTNIPDNKSFEVTVPIEIKDGKRSFPDLVLTCKPDGKFETQTIHLGEEWEKLDSIKLDRDERAHTIKINDPVQINEVRIPYNPPGGAH
jgi:hypothetical protein